MANLNFTEAVIGGRITSDLELKKTPNGVSVCKFSVAVNRRTSSGGDGEKTADFFNVVTRRATAEFVSKYFRKGSTIVVSGPLECRSWNDKNGTKHTMVELVAERATFVDSKNEIEPSNTASPNPYSETPTFAEIETDEDLPF